MNTVNQWATVATIWLGLTGQSIFLALYATRPWREYRITRALMMKSFAFWLIFVLSATRLVTRGLRPNVDDSLALIIFQLILDALIVFAIWYQAIALAIEVRQGRKQPLT